jgi:RNA polymerase sigma factor (sigma-70 family)
LNQETAFVEMIKENETLIFKITAIYGNNPEDKQDLYQEIVLQLWRSFKKFKGEAKASTWIYRVALNTAISRLRKEKKSTDTVPYDTYVHSFTDTQDTILEERSKELHHQISRLNDIEKAVILLYLENKSYSEIAEITGITASNVSTKMGRIKEKLKKKITKH